MDKLVQPDSFPILKRDESGHIKLRLHCTALTLNKLRYIEPHTKREGSLQHTQYIQFKIPLGEC